MAAVNYSSTSEQSLNTEEKRPSKTFTRYISLFLILSTGALQSSFTGVQAVLELYFTRYLFVCSSISRAKTLSTIIVNIFIALSQFSALTGGLLADYILGNYHTQNISNLLATVGLALVVVSSWQYSINVPTCCKNATIYSSNCSELTRHHFVSVNLSLSPSLSVVLILFGLMIFAVGYGHTNAIQSVFVGDQFTDEQSSAKTKSFSWYYLAVNVGNLVCESGMPVSRQSLGFLITLLLTWSPYTLSTLLFLLGTWTYHRKKPVCCKKPPQEESQTLLKDDKLCHNDVTTSSRDTCYQLFRISGVYIPMIIFWAIFFQQNSTWVLQGTQMNCYLGSLHIPPDLMPSINDLMVIIFIPLLDYIVYPHIQQVMNITIKPLHKLTAGMICAMLSFILACLLQMYISEEVHNCRGSVSLLWQLPQLVFISFAEVLVAVTGLEFAYSQSPPKLRNVIKALWCITQALGSVLNIVIALIAFPLVYQFLLYSIIMAIVIAIFVLVNKNYKYYNTTDGVCTKT